MFLKALIHGSIAFLVVILPSAGCLGKGDPISSTPPVSSSSVLGQESKLSSTLSPENTNPNFYVQLAKKVVPSVVNIATSVTVKSPYSQGAPDDLFRKFFEEFFGPGWEGAPDEHGRRNRPRRGTPRNLPKSISLGTGFVVDKNLIITNNHVVAEADEIKIAFTESDEKLTDGEVVGRDPELDVALIKVNTNRELTPLPLGDSDALEVGEYVMAVGNPFGQGHSVTHGIISAKGRVQPQFPLAAYIQTDAPINPGNSGGPLVNLKGEVIGINNAIDARAQGIGFAIPSNSVKVSLQQLKTKGSVSRGYIGVLVGELTPELAEKLGASSDLRAPLITSVTPGEPADKAGIKPYDIILEVNGKRIHNSTELISMITSVSVGETARIKISRNGSEKEFKVKIGRRPAGDEQKEKNKEKKKKSEAPARIETGMTLQEITPEIASELALSPKIKGVVVSDIDYGGPADKAGMNRGDVILEVDRKEVKDISSFYSIVNSKKSYLLRVRKAMPGQSQDVYAVVVLDLKGE